MSARKPPEDRFRVSDKRVRVDGPSAVAGGVQADVPGTGSDAAETTSEQQVQDLGRIAAELEEATRLAGDRLDQLMRLKADYENYRKRVIREQTDIVERASLRVVEQLLPVLDNFERAISAAQEHDADQGLLKGVELVFRQLHDVLSAEGLERVEAEGLPFDPREHEAMLSQPAEVDEPTVLEVVRPGYKLKGRTIRAALVKVATPSGEEEEG